MKSPELAASLIFGAPASSTSSPASPSLIKTPRWGSIRQCFSGIQSRDTPLVPVDSVDEAMWDKNDAAFLEEVARSSPLLHGSPDRLDSLAPVFEHAYNSRPSMSSSRVPSFVRPHDSEQHSLTHRMSHPFIPSSATASTPSSSASAASASSTPVATYDEFSAPTTASTNPWPRPMRSMPSATLLPNLPEQNHADDIITFSRPSTSCSSAASFALPLLPPTRSSASFVSNSFPNVHTLQSPGGKSTTHSSVRSSPSFSHSVHAESDRAPFAIAEQYPRSPSIHSSSSFTPSAYTFRLLDDRAPDHDGRVRTMSSASTTSSAPLSLARIDRCASRSAVGSPLALGTPFVHSHSSSPDAFLHDHDATCSPLLSHVAAETDLAAAAVASSVRSPTIASVLDSPQMCASAAHMQRPTPPFASEPFAQGAGDQDAARQASATASGKRVASSSMRGVPGRPTKSASAIVAPTSALASSWTAPNQPVTSAASALTRKHTKNKSSLVSGLRKWMGKKDIENKGPVSTPDAAPPAESASARPTLAALVRQSTERPRWMGSRAMSIDAPTRGDLNLVGLAPDAFGPEPGVEASRGPLNNQSNAKGSTAHASPNMTRHSPSLDLLRSFGTMRRVSQAMPSESAEEEQTAPASPRSRAKSIDGLTRPLRDVLTQQPRKDSNIRAAARTSVIEHISHNEARRMTGSSGPVILRTKEALEEHRSQYTSFPSEIGLPDRSNFDMHHHASPRLRQANEVDKAAGLYVPKPASSAGPVSAQLPVRPQRPEDASTQDAASIEMLTLSDSGGAVSGTGGHNVGGISSSGSSFVSSSSAATDPSVASRAQFSFQSQAYRPYSRESRGSSSRTQPSPPSSPSSFGVHLVDAAPFGIYDFANGSTNRTHRGVASVGPQSALMPVQSGQTLDSSSSEASTMMPPPAFVPTTKRAHNSRRSLNSLVSSKPWARLLGSPILGSSSSSSSLSHKKRVSTASISRPLVSSTFSSDLHSFRADAADAADLTLRASDFASAHPRGRVDSTHSHFSEPGFAGWQRVAAVGANSNNSSSVHVHSDSPTHTVTAPLAALAPPAAQAAAAQAAAAQAAAATAAATAASVAGGSSSSSLHSYLSHSNHSTLTASASASSSTLAPALATAPHWLIPAPSSPAHRQQGPSPLGRPAVGDSSTFNQSASPDLISSGSLQPSGISVPSVAAPQFRPSSLHTLEDIRASASFTTTTSLPTAFGFSSRSRAPGAGHRSSVSSSSLSPRKRPSFGLAIEPAAHSAFDSIPSPLLRTYRISPALPESATPRRPFSASSASAAAQTPAASSSSTSLDESARASATSLSSSLIADEDSVEIETLRDSIPIKVTDTLSGPLWAAHPQFQASVPALENAMATASLHHISNRRHSVSVPMDEGDSPYHHQEESWNRVTGGTLVSHDGAEDPPQPQPQPQSQPHRQFMIHSPNEEGPALVAPGSASSGRLSQASKDIAFGSIAGMVSKVFEHPFDLVKVRLQTQSADRPPRYAGAFDCFKQTYLQEGIRGLYRGLSMPVLGATLENACLFFTYNQIQSVIRWVNGEASSASAAKADAESPLSIPQLAIAAAGAGAMTSVVLTPIELIKCKMQVQMITREQHAPAPSAAAIASTVSAAAQPHVQQQRLLYTSAIRSASSGASSSAQTFKSLDGPLTLLRRTVAADGVRGLWLGQTGTLLRETGGGIAWFLAFESCSRYLIARKKAQWKRDNVTKKDLTSLELVGAGALAGISYNVVLFPADCVKSTMQTEQEMRAVSSSTAAAGEKFKGTGFYGTFNKIYTTRGIRGLYAGCGVTCLRSAPSSAIIFLMYNKLEKLSDDYGL